MALINRKLTGIETSFLMADERMSFVSSSLIREVCCIWPYPKFLPSFLDSVPFVCVCVRVLCVCVCCFCRWRCGEKCSLILSRSLLPRLCLRAWACLTATVRQRTAASVRRRGERTVSKKMMRASTCSQPFAVLFVTQQLLALQSGGSHLFFFISFARKSCNTAHYYDYWFRSRFLRGFMVPPAEPRTLSVIHRVRASPPRRLLGF